MGKRHQGLVFALILVQDSQYIFIDIWTIDNIINYISDPDEVNDKKYPMELQVARKALREEDEAAKKDGGTFDWNYLLTRMDQY